MTDSQGSVVVRGRDCGNSGRQEQPDVPRERFERPKGGGLRAVAELPAAGGNRMFRASGSGGRKMGVCRKLRSFRSLGATGCSARAVRAPTCAAQVRSGPADLPVCTRGHLRPSSRHQHKTLESLVGRACEAARRHRRRGAWRSVTKAPDCAAASESPGRAGDGARYRPILPSMISRRMSRFPAWRPLLDQVGEGPPHRGCGLVRVPCGVCSARSSQASITVSVASMASR